MTLHQRRYDVILAPYAHWEKTNSVDTMLCQSHMKIGKVSLDTLHFLWLACTLRLNHLAPRL